jgi:hypothetical protein
MGKLRKIFFQRIMGFYNGKISKHERSRFKTLDHLRIDPPYHMLCACARGWRNPASRPRGRDDDNRCPGLGPNDFDDLQTIHIRQFQIQQDDIGIMGSGHGQALGPAGSLQLSESLAFQGRLDLRNRRIGASSSITRTPQSVLVMAFPFGENCRWRIYQGNC